MADGGDFGVAMPQSMPVSEGASQLPVNSFNSEAAPAWAGIGPGNTFMQMENANNDQAMINRKLMSNDLQNQINQVAATVAQANQPALLQKAANTEAALTGAAPYMSGLGAATAGADIATNRGTMLKFQMEQAQARLTAMSQVGENLKDSPLDPNSPADVVRAYQMSSALAGAGIEVTPQELYDPNFGDKLSSATKVLTNSVAQRQKQLDQELKNKGELEKQQEASKGAANVAKINDVSRQAVQNIKAASEREKINMLAGQAKTGQAAFTNLTTIIQRRGGLQPQDVPAVEAAARSYVESDEASKVGKTLTELSQDPNAWAIENQKISGRVDQLLQQVFGANWPVAKAQYASTSVAGNGQPGSPDQQNQATSIQRTMRAFPSTKGGDGSLYQAGGKVYMITDAAHNKGRLATPAEIQAYQSGQ